MVEAAITVEGHPWERAYPKDVPWNTPIAERAMFTILDEAASRFADRPAVEFLGKRYSYAEVRNLVDRMAKGLQTLGVQKGTRVGLFMPNTPYFVISYFAVMKAGGTVVNYNPLYAERELAKQIEDSQTEWMITLDVDVLYKKLKGLIGDHGVKRLIVAKMADILPFPKNLLFPILKRKDIAAVTWDDRHIPFSRVIDNDGRPAPVRIDPRSDVAVLQYTGGTTGVPKGAMLTHANLYANTVQARLWFVGAREGEEKMLGVLPLFHVFAMTAVMNLGIYIGAELILLPRFELKQVLEVIHKKRPSLFPAVPTIYTAINNEKDAAKYDLSSIRYCLSGGAPLPMEVKLAFEKKTGCRLVEGYGLSESSPVAICNPVHGLNKSGSIGLPVPGTVIEIVSLEDRNKVLPLGERGEVCITGPQVMAGYWNKPEETADTLVNGRLHTGDVGYMDEEGYTFIVDRIKDMILCGGYNVYPRNVEEAIYLHPAVSECVVAGVPDEYRGQTVKAYIRLADGKTLTKDDLVTFLKDKLSPIEIPKIVEFRDELPKTLIGKLSRKALLDEEQARREAQAQGTGQV